MQSANNALAAGVAISFPILSIGPNQWTVRWKGEEKIITVPGHDNINQPFIDVVILDVQKDMSRVYYKDAFGGQRNKPDCWASDGVRPDDEVPNPINPVCATCPMSAWGSGASAAAPKAQACQQRRRTVLVPYGDDLTNESEGGPMLLSVPPGSLTNQANYKELLSEIVDGDQVGVPYFGIVTRLSFEQKDQKGQAIKYPKIKFDYIRQQDGVSPYWLNDEQARVVLPLRESEAVKRILNSKIATDGPDSESGSGGSGAGGVKPPPPKPAIPTGPTKAQTAQPAQAKPAGARPAHGITEAVNSPAAPPPSARPVQTTAPAKPQLRSVPPAPVEDNEEEAHAPLPGGASSVFDSLMGGD